MVFVKHKMPPGVVHQQQNGTRPHNFRGGRNDHRRAVTYSTCVRTAYSTCIHEKTKKSATPPASDRSGQACAGASSINVQGSEHQCFALLDVVWSCWRVWFRCCCCRLCRSAFFVCLVCGEHERRVGWLLLCVCFFFGSQPAGRDDDRSQRKQASKQAPALLSIYLCSNRFWRARDQATGQKPAESHNR